MTKQRTGQEGYLLVGLLVIIFIVLLTLGVAAPLVRRSLQRDQEVESMHRAQQYQRAIQVFYRKLGHYPGSLDQLENTNNQRFLRKRYKDPLTGKDDWRLIHVGEAKAQIKGFFGQPLGAGSGGLGSVSGMSSGFGQTTTSTSATGSTGATGSTSPFGGIGSQSASGFQGSGGLIVGVGTSKTGSSILAINGDETKYEDWEFTYDPRIEQLRAQASLFGGSAASSGGSAATFGSTGSTGNTGAPGSTGVTTPQ